jgi:hypothetical protein
MNIITRKEAQAQGLKTYFTGKPCKRGHVAARRVNPNACVECLKEAKRKPPAEIQVCEHCGGEFRPHVRSRKVRFCSVQCNASFNNGLRSKGVAARNAQEELLNQWLPGYMPRAKAMKLGLRHYFVAAPCPLGHIAPHLVAGGCVVCQREVGRMSAAKRRAADPEAARKRDRERVRPRTEEVRAKEAAKRERRRNDIRAYSRAYQVARRQSDPQYRLRCALAGRVSTALRKQYGQKAAKTMALVGCTIPELMAHLEAQFLPGMTWDNHSLDGWHVDHIRPCASFDLTDPEQQRECFHYTNLQPLWAFDNISKGDKLVA